MLTVGTLAVSVGVVLSPLSFAGAQVPALRGRYGDGGAAVSVGSAEQVGGGPPGIRCYTVAVAAVAELILDVRANLTDGERGAVYVVIGRAAAEVPVGRMHVEVTAPRQRASAACESVREIVVELFGMWSGDTVTVLQQGVNQVVIKTSSGSRRVLLPPPGDSTSARVRCSVRDHNGSTSARC